jgi:hypothetical protein
LEDDYYVERYVSKEVKVVPVIPDPRGGYMLTPTEEELQAMRPEDREILESQTTFRQCSARRIKRSDTVKVILMSDPEDNFPGAKIFADRFHYGTVVQKRYV